jgi:K+-transporting ATPase KdpF subunit
MSLDELLAAIFAVVAFVYLLVALLRPERL